MNKDKIYVLKTNLEKGINSTLHIFEYDNLDDLCNNSVIGISACNIDAISLHNYIEIYKSEDELRKACALYGRSICSKCIKKYYGKFD